MSTSRLRDPERAGDVTWDTKQVKLELRPEARLSPSGRNSLSIESKNCKNATPRRSAEERVCAPLSAGPPAALGEHPQRNQPSDFTHRAGTWAVTSGAHARRLIAAWDVTGTSTSIEIASQPGSCSTERASSPLRGVSAALFVAAELEQEAVEGARPRLGCPSG